MPNCPKCGAKATEAMNFCANCGANLKPSPPPAQAVAPAPAPAPMPPRGEKHEKGEKTEKHEKQQYGPIGPIIGGIVLIALGVFFYLMLTMRVDPRLTWAYFFIVIGIAVILAVIYAASMASRRHPPT